ncbi:MAG: hypothetical protein ABEJ04_02070 [Halobacteriaceae archaeon]
MTDEPEWHEFWRNATREDRDALDRAVERTLDVWRPDGGPVHLVEYYAPSPPLRVEPRHETFCSAVRFPGADDPETFAGVHGLRRLASEVSDETTDVCRDCVEAFREDGTDGVGAVYVTEADSDLHDGSRHLVRRASGGSPEGRGGERYCDGHPLANPVVVERDEDGDPTFDRVRTLAPGAAFGGRLCADCRRTYERRVWADSSHVAGFVVEVEAEGDSDVPERYFGWSLDHPETGVVEVTSTLGHTRRFPTTDVVDVSLTAPAPTTR